MFDVAEHTVFLTLAGSQAHGTAREGSDVDLRGVCIAPLRIRLSAFHAFEQYEGSVPETLATTVRAGIAAHETASRAAEIKTECVIFDIAKLVGLCVAANPNALEILFADERDWVLTTPLWRRLHDARAMFLTKKVRETFLGYAMAQLRRIETHRSWLLDPPKKKPVREDFGLPAAFGALSRDDQNRIEQSIAEKIRSYGLDDLDMPKASRIALNERIRQLYGDVLSAQDDAHDARLREVAVRSLALPSDVVWVLNAEKRFRAAAKHWDSYIAWQAHRNPARAALERAHGYDTKHAMHLVRLMRMGIEALETGELRIRRDDAEALAAIRDGALSFDALRTEANVLRAAMDDAAARSTLPNDVDREAVDALLFSLVTA